MRSWYKHFLLFGEKENKNIKKHDEFFEFENGKVSIFFTPEETQKGRELLKPMGVDFDKDNYICVFSRDSTF